MLKPSLRQERILWRKGYNFIAGLDEVGVGPLAGPVVAGCVICKRGFSFKKSPFANLRDSKSLTPKQREHYAKLLKSDSKIVYSIAKVYPKTIDRINIFNATRLAMCRAIKKIILQPDFLLIDGAALLKRNSLPQRAIVQGDKKIFSIAAASVLAKVTRDKLMRHWAKRLPDYGFEKHKGYGTKLHRRTIKKFGISSLHRQSFLRRFKNSCLLASLPASLNESRREARAKRAASRQI